MKRTFFSFLLFFLFFFSFGQTPGIKWTNYYPPLLGNNLSEVFFDVKATPDSGFILAGSDTAYSNYNKDEYLKKNIGGRPWLVKTNKDGNVLWRVSSGAYNASFTSVQTVSGGGIIAAGYGSRYPSPVKYYIAKYDDNGTEIWFKSYGGASGISMAYSIKQTSDAGYIVAGTTTANDGDVSGNHNAVTADVWLLKLDASGNIQWKKCFGGTGEDSAYAVIQTPDNGFVIAGASASSDGDLTGNNGLSDGWIFKVDNSGNLLWQKNIGGSNDEDFTGIVLNSDTSYTLTGYALSSSVTGNGNHGKKDLWVIKMNDATGQIQWSKSFGGTQDEQGFSIQRTIGNGYLIGGYTESADGDVTNNNGAADAWLLNLTSGGNLVWQKCVGTNKNEFGMGALYLSATDFAIAGLGEPPVPGVPYDSIDGFLSRLGNINTIKGLLFYDINRNGLRDPTEVGFNQAMVTTVKPGFQRSAIPQNGLFNIAADTGSYTTSVKVNNPYYNAIPASVNSTFATYFNTDSFSFAVQPVPGIRDLVIHLIPLSPARIGLPCTYKIYYKNIGTDTVTSGEIIFKHDSRFNIISSSPAFGSSNGDTLKWIYSNLKPFDTASITINMQVLTPPVVNIGDTLISFAVINPVLGDVTPKDDTALVKQRVIGAYDPNNKYENNEGKISQDYVNNGKYLNYLVRFQNTGTDTASLVTISDTLDTKLDWNTFQMVAASHPYQVSITDQNKIVWTFSNINLPDSNVNEPASHGFIAYRIKPNNSVIPGDIIPNTASIYFDFNLPVKTNNAFTVIQNNVVLPLNLLSFSGVYYNEQALLHWATGSEFDIEKFEVQRSFNAVDFISVGEVLASREFNSTALYDFTDNLVNIFANTYYYRLRMTDKDGRISYSQSLLLRTKMKGNNGISISPNPVIGVANINITSLSMSLVKFQVVDVSGRIILQQENKVFEGNNLIPISNILNLQSGFYILQALKDNEKLITPFVIIK